jgi:hypothetical protein
MEDGIKFNSNILMVIQIGEMDSLELLPAMGMVVLCEATELANVAFWRVVSVLQFNIR